MHTATDPNTADPAIIGDADVKLEVLAFVNAARADAGLAPLCLNAALGTARRRFCGRMATTPPPDSSTW